MNDRIVSYNNINMHQLQRNIIQKDTYGRKLKKIQITREGGQTGYHMKTSRNNVKEIKTVKMLYVLATICHAYKHKNIILGKLQKKSKLNGNCVLFLSVPPADALGLKDCPKQMLGWARLIYSQCSSVAIFVTLYLN